MVQTNCYTDAVQETSVFQKKKTHYIDIKVENDIYYGVIIL
jgi:hypothetical protein